MSTFWKAMIGLAMLLPITAYVVGSLTASSAEQSVERSPIVIDDPPSASPSSAGSAAPEPSPTPTPDPAATRELDPLRPPESSDGGEQTVEEDDPDPQDPDRHRAPSRPRASSPTTGPRKPTRGKVDHNGVTVVTPKPTPVTDDNSRGGDDTHDGPDTDDTDDTDD